MLDEALFAAQAVAAQHMYADEGLAVLARELAKAPPQLALTVARGSSDHAANYFAYTISPTWRCSAPARRWYRCRCRC